MGTSITCSGTEMCVLEGVHQLVPRLRHRCIENLHHRSKAHEVDNMLHGVPLDPLLRPWRLCQAGRPPPTGLFVVQAEEHQLAGGGGFCRRGVSFLSSCPSSPALAIFWRCALWCVNAARAWAIDCCSLPPSSTQSSPSSTLGSSGPGLPARVHLETKVTQTKRMGTLGIHSLVVVVVVVVVVLTDS